QMHHPDKNTPIEVSLRAFDDLISQGKVRYVGTSNFTAPLLVETLWRSEVGGFDAPISDQTGYSLIRRQVETDVLPWCRRYGLAFLAYSPLARGTLTGRYHIGDPPEIGSRVERLGFHKTDWWDGTLEVVETLRGHVLEKSCSLTQFAVAWLMRQPSVTPIIGPRTMEQLDDNLGALDVEITDEDLAFVDQISPS
ncbi:MAG: aldo/keto reductase, partial [Candidatus Latescibacteria bacterium]|nr:aldo/keto reductase [Candidatus Latescibacterota bacterium]